MVNLSGYTMDNQFYQNIIRTAPFGYAYHKIVLDKKGNPVDYIFLDVNEAFENLTGLRRKDILNKRITESLPDILSDDFDWIDFYGQIALTGGVKTFEQYSDKLDRHYQVNVHSPEKNYFVTVFLDISKRKLVEDQLLKEKEFTDMALDAQLDTFFLFDAITGKAVRWNKAFREVSGYSDEEIAMMPAPTSYYNTQDIEKAKIIIEKVMIEGKGIVELDLICKDGSKIPTEYIASAVKVDKEEPKYFISIGRDITLRKQAEEKIEKERNKSQQYLDIAEVILIGLNSDGNVVLVNPTACKILGYDESEILNKNWYDNFLPQRLIETVKEVAKQVNSGDLEPVKYFENEIVTKKGEERLIAWHNAVLKDEGGEIIGSLSSGEDITEKKKAEEDLKNALEQAKKSDHLKSAFLANISHEIRTPMNGIMGFAELLKDTKLSGEEQQEYINIIKSSGERMLNIINQLINISLIESGQAKIIGSEVNINEQIGYLHSFFFQEAENKGVKLSFNNQLDDQEAVVYTDLEKINSILTNLVNNAVKYTNEGSVEFGYNKKDNFLEFYVKDTGIGIPINRQQDVFDRFVQADSSMSSKYEGAGLGLSITKAYVKLLGGKIWLESEKGKGSTFYFTLPLEKEEPDAHEEKIAGIDKKKAIDIRDLTIMIAEDEETTLTYLNELLKNKCKKIIQASNGKHAIELFQENNAIDIILMDLKMPQMDGFTATRKIRELDKDVIIIAQTAYAFESDIQKSLDAGCNDYISKPTKKEDLLNLIEKNLLKRTL